MGHFNNDLQRQYSNQIHKAPVRIYRPDVTSGDNINTEVNKAVSAAMGPLMENIRAQNALIADLQAKLLEKDTPKAKAKGHQQDS